MGNWRLWRCMFISVFEFVYVYVFYGLWWLFKVLHPLLLLLLLLMLRFNTVLRHSARIFCPPAVHFAVQSTHTILKKNITNGVRWSHLNNLYAVNENRSGHYVVYGNFPLLRLIIATSSIHAHFFIDVNPFVGFPPCFWKLQRKDEKNTSSNWINPFYQWIQMCAWCAQRTAMKW